MSNYVDAGNYIEVFPVDTIDYCGYLSFFANTWPPSEDVGNWKDDGGDKGINFWYANDVDSSGGSNLQASYGKDEDAGTDVRYFDDTPTTVASAHYSSSQSLYFSRNSFFVWNLNRWRGESFERAEFVADMSAVNSSLGGPQDDAENTVARFDLVPITEFGTEYWDWRRSHTDQSGGNSRLSFSQVESGLYDDFYTGTRAAIPLNKIPTGLAGLRIAVYMRDGSDPVNNNNLAILCDPDSVSGVDHDSQVGSDWHQAIIFDMPCLRLWRPNSAQISAPEFSIDLNINLDATINADLLFHSARRRRNRIRS